MGLLLHFKALYLIREELYVKESVFANNNNKFTTAAY